MIINMTNPAQGPAPAFLRTTAAAAYLGIGKSTLERRRVQGDGPQFRALGRRIIIYAVHDLQAWASEHMYQSTSEKAAK